jgi:hypothetical protein
VMILELPVFLYLRNRPSFMEPDRNGEVTPKMA